MGCELSKTSDAEAEEEPATGYIHADGDVKERHVAWAIDKARNEERAKERRQSWTMMATRAMTSGGDTLWEARRDADRITGPGRLRTAGGMMHGREGLRERARGAGGGEGSLEDDRSTSR